METITSLQSELCSAAVTEPLFMLCEKYLFISFILFVVPVLVLIDSRKSFSSDEVWLLHTVNSRLRDQAQRSHKVYSDSW